jgi:hypothetical protein
MPVIASLTTLPSRINLLRPMLVSILNQSYPVDSIHINIPLVCKRTKEEYVIPKWLESFPKLEIFRTEDYGSITKVAPTFFREKEAYIWSVDDDLAYPPNILKFLIENNRPNAVRYYYDFKLDDLQIFEGFGSILYPPSCIEKDFLEYLEITSALPDCRVSDDVILSNYFVNLERVKVFTRENIHKYVLPYYKSKDATHLQAGGHGVRYKRVIEQLKSLGLWKVPRPVPKPISMSVSIPSSISRSKSVGRLLRCGRK